MDVNEPISHADHTRLRQIAHQCASGQAAAAELELMAWHRRRDCPPQARVLFAALLAIRGQSKLAMDVLGRIKDLAGDAAMLMLSLSVTWQWNQTAEQLAHRLSSSANAAGFGSLLSAMGLANNHGLPNQHAAELASDLAMQPQLIETLVFAQKHQPDPRQLPLLRRALKLVDDQNTVDRLLLCRARAELALVAADHTEARALARAGLEIEPYDARLALILAEADDQYPAHLDQAQPSVSDLLQRITIRFPRYADVRAAWIRRLFREGEATTARQISSRWLIDEPASTVAKQVAQEVAA